MERTVNQVIHGFRVTRNEACPELKGQLVSLVHEKTGAPVFWLDNGAENKTFSIAFRTLPEDHTGVFHILEHSVLCGSRKYPVREPFVELLKSSMSTFLNAMTFPDMTMYPVSSRNDRDLMNLTGVYLDAVFAPVCAEQEKVFRQEGWHMEPDEEGRMVYKGVVYNEMKGSMSDTDTLMEHHLLQQLFPDTCYGFNSGGDPDHIPDLTWEQFRETYHRFYHPSNAFVYLDGEVPLEEMLALLDSYFAAYEPLKELPAFKMQKPAASEKTVFYELDAEEDPENRGYLTLGRLVGSWRDRAENTARSIVADVLTGSNEAPLKREILEKGLAQDFSISIDDTSLQSWITLHAENVTDGKEEDILALLKKAGERIRREGLDREAAEASLNRTAYHLREEEEPQGLGRCIRAMGTWLYGGDPAEALKSEELIRRLREMLANGEMDALAADMLLGQEGLAVLHTRPSHTLGQEKRAAEAERLRHIAESWTEEERQANETMLAILQAWQSEPDSEEALATLPMLTREDADVAMKPIPTEEKEINGVRVWFHALPCNGVVHLRVYLPLTDLNLEELTCAGLVASMLGKLPTEKHDALKLQQEIRRLTGYFGFSVGVKARRGEEKVCIPYLTAFAGALAENADAAAALLAEVLTSTRFDQEDRMVEIVQQTELGVRQRLVSAGHVLAVRNVLAHFSAEQTVRNALEGDRAVRYIHAFAKDPEAHMAAFRTLAEKIRGESCCRKRMTLSVTAEQAWQPDAFLQAFPEGTAVAPAAAYQAEAPMARGYRIPAQIGFMARGGRLSRYGQTFNGCMLLTASILSLDYLWNRIRVRGGAYGTGFQVDRAGNVSTYSFRDPTPGKSLEADSECLAFLKEFAERGENLDKYIISTLNELNPLLSSRDLGTLADVRQMTGTTEADVEKTRREILKATMQDILDCSGWLDRFAKEGAVCVVAHQDALDVCQGLEISEI